MKDSDSRNEDPSIKVRRASTGLLTASLAMIIAGWATEKPSEPLQSVLWTIGISSLAFSLSSTFFTVLISNLWRGSEISDGPSEEIHLLMLKISIFSIGMGFLGLVSSFSYFAGALCLAGFATGHYMLQAFIAGMLSEAASPPYGSKGPRNYMCYPPYIIITKCRPNPGGELWGEWVEIKNFWNYSTSLNRLRITISYGNEEHVYWEGSSQNSLNRREKIRIYTGEYNSSIGTESRGIGTFTRCSTPHTNFQFTISRFEGSTSGHSFNQLTLHLQAKTEDGFTELDNVEIPTGNGPGKILKRGFFCSLGHSNHFDNAYKRN